MPSDNEALEATAMIAAYHELKYAIKAGEPSESAINAVAMIERALEARIKAEERMLKWAEASCDARDRAMKAHRRPT
jgi:hypothetical protein